jgi:hypothetical protein
VWKGRRGPDSIANVPSEIGKTKIAKSIHVYVYGSGIRGDKVIHVVACKANKLNELLDESQVKLHIELFR